jgi:hypothetical protein
LPIHRDVFFLVAAAAAADDDGHNKTGVALGREIRP